MSAYQEHGSIRIRITEGHLVSIQTGRPPRFQPIANVATFSWTYGPLGRLEHCAMAYERSANGS